MLNRFQSAVALRLFSIGREIYENMKIKVTPFKQNVKANLRQFNFKVQSFFHFCFGTLRIGAIQHRHVNLKTVVSANHFVFDSFQQERLRKTEICLVKL